MSPVDVSLYLDRLELKAESLDELPTADKLCALQEAHLRHVPFENTAQHGVHGGLPTLDIAKTADKVLVKRRGGFCLELNMLFAELLRNLGYAVTLTPATVYHDPAQAYFAIPSHVTLAVRVHDGSLWLADVGFGEPPLHPIRYDKQQFGVVQATTEGMHSKLTLAEDGDTVELWWMKGDGWARRLKWSYEQSNAVPGAAHDADVFQRGLQFVLGDPSFSKRVAGEQSPFVKSLIVCSITRGTKTSLAGNRLKITTNRFQDSEKVQVRNLQSVDEARQVLLDEFGIPLDSSLGLNIDFAAKDKSFGFL